jgi:hypothetical protein
MMDVQGGAATNEYYYSCKGKDFHWWFPPEQADPPGGINAEQSDGANNESRQNQHSYGQSAVDKFTEARESLCGYVVTHMLASSTYFFLFENHLSAFTHGLTYFVLSYAWTMF